MDFFTCSFTRSEYVDLAIYSSNKQNPPKNEQSVDMEQSLELPRYHKNVCMLPENERNDIWN